YASQDVVFCESTFPFASSQPTKNLSPLQDVFYNSDWMDTMPADVSITHIDVNEPDSMVLANISSTNESSPNTQLVEIVMVQPIERRSTQFRHLPHKLNDYSFALPTSLSPTTLESHLPTPSANSLVYPLSQTLSYSNISSAHNVLLAAIIAHDEPSSFSQVV